MCGIVGAIANYEIKNSIINSLKLLEYRGYDSAGIAIIDNKTKKTQCFRATGKIENLEKKIKQDCSFQGNIGIAHTRWATHGGPSEKNAHPHCCNSHKTAIVHNGIIENHLEIKKFLKEEGHTTYTSDTDSEVIAHLIDFHLKTNSSLVAATKKTCDMLQGSYAIAVINSDFPDQLIGTCNQSPMVVGIGNQGHYIASDPLALINLTDKYIYLNQQEVIQCYPNHLHLYNKDMEKTFANIHTLDIKTEKQQKHTFKHYMLKEIYEQPEIIHRLINQENLLDKKDALSATLNKIDQVYIIACGSSYYSGMTAKYWFESISKIPCHVETASEFRYRSPVIPKNSLCITISQSGETADTIACLRYLASHHPDLETLSICNVPHSTLPRESTYTIITEAGPEIGVASTKAFTAQLIRLLQLVLHTAKLKQQPISEYTLALTKLPEEVQHILALDNKIKLLATKLINYRHSLFIARGECFPIALEGALKLKEISYIHAEAYPAGELKHGPIALIDNKCPTIVIAPNNQNAHKVFSNVAEIQARNGPVFLLCPGNSPYIQPLTSTQKNYIIPMPGNLNPLLSPITYTIALQLLAYHTADLKGHDIDQPRNLAKCVTVE